MLIKRKISLDYGHTLPRHYSFCNQIHGHLGEVIATLEGDVIQKENDSSQGMVMDFKIVKEIMMKKIHAVLDHGFAVWEKDMVDLEFIKKRNTRYLITKEPPTAEYLAKWAFKQIEPELPNGIKLIKVEWFETRNSSAIYEEEAK